MKANGYKDDMAGVVHSSPFPALVCCDSDTIS